MLPHAIARRLLPIIALTVVSACTPLAPQEARPARSTLSCIRSTLAAKVPEEGLPDHTAHCLAAGFIARYCSTSEAHLAGLAKEMRDAVTAGDAAWRDLQSNRRGIKCARSARNDDALYERCDRYAQEAVGG